MNHKRTIGLARGLAAASLLCCNGALASRGQLELQASGRAEYTLGDGPSAGQTFTEPFEVYVSNTVYRIVHYPDPRHERPVDRIEVDYDGRVSRRVKHLVPGEVRRGDSRRPTRSPQEAVVIVDEGPQPAPSDPVAAFVWLALCSAGVYRDGVNPDVRPLLFLGAAYEKADIRLTAYIRLARDGSGRVASRADLHPPFAFLWDDNRLIKKSLAHGYTNLFFRVTAWTNRVKGKLPLRAEFKLYSWASSQPSPHLDFSGILLFTNYAALNRDALRIAMPRHIVVHDLRFSRFGFAESVTYRRADGRILTINELKKTVAFRQTAEHARKTSRPTPTRVVLVIAAIGIALAPAVVLLWRGKRRGRIQDK